ncbi:hypothetical protein [uncultured Litoreibacter sp.]|uniref:hypothetical protein n=1 Tax=uncultured Litoreibacter sp. TaxID=1392394 RepID=UPI002624151C|nr:hypothetical protein [uncultured Litoreibacter sp.]
MDDKPITDLKDERLIVEEKRDEANSAVYFDANGNLMLQSSGHYMTGGGTLMVY